MRISIRAGWEKVRANSWPLGRATCGKGRIFGCRRGDGAKKACFCIRSFVRAHDGAQNARMYGERKLRYSKRSCFSNLAIWPIWPTHGEVWPDWLAGLDGWVWGWGGKSWWLVAMVARSR